MAAYEQFDPYAFLATPHTRVEDPGPAEESFTALAGLAAEGRRPHRNVAEAERQLATSAGLAEGAGSASESAEPATRGDKAANPANEGRGSTPAAWAAGVARLDPECPPRRVPPRCWRQFIYDAARFVDSRFAGQAFALGWNAEDLFGCDSDRPYERIDQAGLIWLLDGNRLVALTEGAACIEMRGGVRQTYRRRLPGDNGCVLAWELET